MDGHDSARAPVTWRRRSPDGRWWLSPLGEAARVGGAWYGYPGDTTDRGSPAVPFILATLGPFAAGREARAAVEAWWANR